MLEEILHAIIENSTRVIDNVTFSVPIKAIRVPKYIQLYTSYKIVMVGEHPNHLISLEGKIKVEVLSIIEYENMVMEENIPVSVISLQLVCVVFLPYDILCGRP